MILEGTRQAVILNLGCGDHVHPDMVNIDWSFSLRVAKSPVLRALFKPLFTGARHGRLDELSGAPIVLHDLRKGIPFDDSSVDVVYHSHVIEHIDRDAVPAFLAETLRVLKPGGVMRVVCPDLAILATNYLRSYEELSTCAESVRRHDDSIADLFEQMVRTSASETAAQRPLRRRLETLALGGARRRGENHLWAYDAVSLGRVCQRAGFTDGQVVSSTESRIPDWDRLALDHDKDSGLDRKPGSLFFECRRPVGSSGDETFSSHA